MVQSALARATAACDQGSMRRTVLLFCLILAACRTGGALPDPLRQRNLGETALFAAEAIDSILSAERTLATAERLGRWARRFLADPDSEYRFGLKDGGYVSEGLLVSDHRQDCVSLLYRSCELARARDHEDALRLALSTRFPGAPLDSLVDATGRVDYDRPEHLDYSLDMIRSGHWGADITPNLDGAAPDSAGSARYAPGSFLVVPESALDTRELREGDVLWFVLDPTHEGARRLRDEHGLVIGHIGLLIIENDTVRLVHAASSDLPGEYEGGRVVSVSLTAYLERVERFGAVMVTRFAD